MHRNLVSMHTCIHILPIFKPNMSLCYLLLFVLLHFGTHWDIWAKHSTMLWNITDSGPSILSCLFGFQAKVVFEHNRLNLSCFLLSFRDRKIHLSNLISTQRNRSWTQQNQVGLGFKSKYFPCIQTISKIRKFLKELPKQCWM